MATGQWIKIKGLKQTLALLRDKPSWIAQPLHDFYERWGSRAERKAKANFNRRPGTSWLDTATTRKSITHATDPGPWPVWARFGSNLQTARWGDMGTGLLSEDPDSSRRRHWPPAHALERFAKKKGIEGGGFVVARAIGRRGGLRPRRFIRDAAEDSYNQIPRYLSQLAKDIETAAGQAGGGGHAG